MDFAAGQTSTESDAIRTQAGERILVLCGAGRQVLRRLEFKVVSSTPNPMKSKNLGIKLYTRIFSELNRERIRSVRTVNE